MPDLLVDHIGIINRQEEEAVEFYQNLLGLEKIRESFVPPELSRKLFNLFQEIRMLVFVRGNLKIEVFVIPGFTPPISQYLSFLPPDSSFSGASRKTKTGWGQSDYRAAWRQNRLFYGRLFRKPYGNKTPYIISIETNCYA